MNKLYHSILMKLFVLVMCLTFVSCTQTKLIENAGINGNSTNDLLIRVNEDVINKKPTIVLLMIGTNDMLNVRKMISYSEYEHNLTKIAKSIQENDINLLLITPPPVDSSYIFRKYNKSHYPTPPNAKIDSICKIIKSVSIQLNTELIDINNAFKQIDAPKHNSDLLIMNELNSGIKDGVHPTEKGYHFIAKTIFEHLKEESLLNTEIKIICFGDSITFGYLHEGGGSINGKNYPSFLNTMIIDYLNH